MKKRKEVSRLLLLAILPTMLTGIATPAQAEDATGKMHGRSHRELFFLPVEIEGEQHLLQAMTLRPSAEGEFPLAVILHGSPRDAASRRGMQLMAYYDQAEEFVKRGYCVLLFMRRGYGASDGAWSESYKSGETADYIKAGKATAKETKAVIAKISEFEYINGNELIVIGQSAGGFGAVALGASPPKELKLIVNFAGGRGSSRDDFVFEFPTLINAFGEFGKTSRVPSLWIYSKNDRFFPPKHAKKFHERFTHSGGVVEFIEVDAFGKDGHGLFASRDGLAIWRPILSRALERQGLSNWRVEPPLPEADKQKPPTGLSEKGLRHWDIYLKKAGHKAWAYDASNGNWGYKTRMNTREAAIQAALEVTGGGARIISVDGLSPDEAYR